MRVKVGIRVTRVEVGVGVGVGVGAGLGAGIGAGLGVALGVVSELDVVVGLGVGDLCCRKLLNVLPRPDPQSINTQRTYTSHY